MSDAYKEIDVDPGQVSPDGIVSTIIPITRYGITQNDSRSFFMKSAAYEGFAKDFSNLDLAEGEIPLHVNAMGATEIWTCNRKGDSFKRAALKDTYKTFLTDGNVFIHHENSDPKRRYGVIKGAAYNDKMDRVELFIVANGSKKAAEKNNGLVLPNEFLDRIHSTKEAAFSMACFVKGDVCSICNKFTRFPPKGYCDEETCRNPKTGEYGLGCKHGLGKTMEDGRMQYVDNIEPRFVDISFVGVPADRSAYGHVADYAAKKASFFDVFPDFADYQSNDAGLLKMAADVAAGPTVEGFILSTRKDNGIGKAIGKLNWQQKFAAFKKLADYGQVLSPDEFSNAVGAGSREAIVAEWDGVFERLAGTKAAAAWCDGIKSAERYSGVDAMLENFPITVVTPQSRRSAVIEMSQYDLQKRAGFSDPRPAELYAVYLTAAIGAMPEGLKSAAMTSARLL